MRIAYLFQSSLGSGSGVHKKIVSQIRHWTRNKHEVGIFQILVQDHVPEHYADGSWTTFHYDKDHLASRFAAYKKGVEAALNWNPEVVYLRYDMYYPSVARLAKRIPTVVEINTDDLREFQLYSRGKHIYNQVTRHLLLRRVAGFVFVSSEFPRLPQFDRFKKPYEVIANGIDLDEFQVLPSPANDHPQFVFICQSGAPWHGLDKLITLANLRPEWQFHVIGMGLERAGPGNVCFHGRMTPGEYTPIFSQADFGIGTLALHRKGMEEASPLKVREYLSCGLPTIIGYKDTDFPSDVPFILKLPNTEENVTRGIEKIDEFVRLWKGKRVSHSWIEQLDENNKERKRLSFLESVL